VGAALGAAAALSTATDESGRRLGELVGGRFVLFSGGRPTSPTTQARAIACSSSESKFRCDHADEHLLLTLPAAR
jgi:hypothetical protein